MKVALVADSFSVEVGTSIARYSQGLLTGLTEAGLDVRPVCSTLPDLPFGAAINHAVRMPYLVRSEADQFDLIHATRTITALGFPLVSKPKVVTYHDLLVLLCSNTSSSFHSKLFAPLFLRIGRFADHIIAISSQTKEEMIEHIAMPEEKITVVPYGISEMFRPLRTGHRDEYVIGYVGALDRRKGVDFLLRAFHVLQRKHGDLSVKLVICGKKELEYSALRELATTLEIDRHVEFRGFAVGEALVRAYSSFDVFVLPSVWEGFGFPILEAQRCGVPAIIREDAHIPAEVSRCCLKASSEDDMAEKIYELLTDANLRQAMVEEGLEYSHQFTWERTVEETLDVYEEAVS